MIKQALPNFISPTTPDELAGLSLEDIFESRLITGFIKRNQWQLKNEVFNRQDFVDLPARDWTLLVKWVDKYIDTIYQFIAEFDFIPRWRFDDVMISYAATGVSVESHFDYYDVFLLQGTGKRRWHLSIQDCELDNYLAEVPLRIMKQFKIEQVLDVEPGDVLYIPLKIAHHGVNLDDECTTLSFGYRIYSAQKLFEFVDKPCLNAWIDAYYQDPQWLNNEEPALIPNNAIVQAKTLLAIDAISFAQFVTKLDTLNRQNLQLFEHDNPKEKLDSQSTYQLHPMCKIAYLRENNILKIFINSEALKFKGISDTVLIAFCNKRSVDPTQHLALAQQLFENNLLLAL